jgi:hypothetical protein
MYCRDDPAGRDPPLSGDATDAEIGDDAQMRAATILVVLVVLCPSCAQNPRSKSTPYGPMGLDPDGYGYGEVQTERGVWAIRAVVSTDTETGIASSYVDRRARQLCPDGYTWVTSPEAASAFDVSAIARCNEEDPDDPIGAWDYRVGYGCVRGCECGATCISCSKTCRTNEPAAATSYGSSGSTRATGCVKGCRCGNSCIDCSKTCRGGSTYRKRKRR